MNMIRVSFSDCEDKELTAMNGIIAVMDSQNIGVRDKIRIGEWIVKRFSDELKVMYKVDAINSRPFNSPLPSLSKPVGIPSY